LAARVIRATLHSFNQHEEITVGADEGR